MLYGYEGLRRVEVAEASAGDIVALAGIENIEIGETVAELENPQALPLIRIDEPPVWLDPAEVAGVITPFWVLYAMHDALVKPMPGNLLTPSLTSASGYS